MEIADVYKILSDSGVPTEDVVHHGLAAYEHGVLAAIRKVTPQVQVHVSPDGYLVQGPGGVSKTQRITRLLGVAASVAGGDYAAVATALGQAAEREILREVEARIRIARAGSNDSGLNGGVLK